jgi:hypothetical protein
LPKLMTVRRADRCIQSGVDCRRQRPIAALNEGQIGNLTHLAATVYPRRDNLPKSRVGNEAETS